MIRGRLRPLTKNGDNGTYAKYYPSSPFLPSVALGTLLTTNLFLARRVSKSLKESEGFKRSKE